MLPVTVGVVWTFRDTCRQQWSYLDLQGRELHVSVGVTLIFRDASYMLAWELPLSSGTSVTRESGSYLDLQGRELCVSVGVTLIFRDASYMLTWELP